MKAFRKQLVFFLIPTAIFFGGAEIILALFGVRPLLNTDDPLVGFAGNNTLFVEQQMDGGEVILTTVNNKLKRFNPQQFPKIKADNSYRIFCIGGSTTYGRPYLDSTSFCGWLRSFLKAADPSRQWEVINAGGVSYASYRVARVMNELAQYDPDHFIIYTGQNEFLEQRTYGKLLELPSWVLELDSVLSETRTYSVLRRMIREFQPGTTELSKKPQFSSEVDDILSQTLGPTSFHRDDKLKQDVLEHFRLNLSRMIKMSRGANAKSMLVMPVVNLKDMSPFKSEHKTGLTTDDLNRFNALIKKTNKMISTKSYTQALNLLAQGEAIDDRFADLHFLKGKIQFELKLYDEAKKSFWRAVDEDVAPLRMLSFMEPIITEVASDYGVPLVDFKDILGSAYSKEYGHTVFGNEYFLDQVHTNIEGYRLLGLGILDQLIHEGIVSPTSEWGDKRIAAVTKQVIAELDTETHSIALRNLGQILDWAGKFDEAQNIFFQRLDLIGPDNETYALIGKNYYRNNNLNEAIIYFNKAVELAPNDVLSHRWLGNLQHIKNNHKAAIFHYTEALKGDSTSHFVHDKLGVLLAIKGNVESAAHHFKEAIRLNPGYEPALTNLMLLMIKQHKYNEAIDFGNEILLRNPEMEKIYNLLGVVRGAQGEYNLAAEHFSAALRINPDYIKAQTNLKIAKTKLKLRNNSGP